MAFYIDEIAENIRILCTNNFDFAHRLPSMRLVIQKRLIHLCYSWNEQRDLHAKKCPAMAPATCVCCKRRGGQRTAWMRRCAMAGAGHQRTARAAGPAARWLTGDAAWWMQAGSGGRTSRMYWNSGNTRRRTRPRPSTGRWATTGCGHGVLGPGTATRIAPVSFPGAKSSAPMGYIVPNLFNEHVNIRR